MIKEIIVKRGMVKEIAAAIGVSERAVHKALRYQTNGKKSIAARKLAIEKMKEYQQ